MLHKVVANVVYLAKNLESQLRCILLVQVFDDDIAQVVEFLVDITMVVFKECDAVLAVAFLSVV